MPTPDLVIIGPRVVLPDGVRPAAVIVRDGRIDAVTAPDAAPACANVVRLDDAVLLPGLVDTHVHVNEPGRTEWEGFASATRAAAAGGVTTIVDMPLNSTPATTTVDALAAKRDAAAGQCVVDYGFWGGVVPGNADALPDLLDAGVLGFKCFLAPSGVDDFPAVTEADLRRVLPLLATRDAVLLAHAEDPVVLDAARADSGLDENPRRAAAWLASRPPAAEVAAIAMLVALARETGARVHVVHVAAADALPVLAAARRDGVRITAETCPHYLTLAADDIPDGAPEFKCAPPIRDATHRERLWVALAEGNLDLVASDHSPCLPDMKHLRDGDFAAAWGGIASLQLGLPLVWSGARRRGLAIERVVEWMAAAPARLAGLHEGKTRKGCIAAGADADLVAFDPYARLVVEPERLEHRHPTSPYTGLALHGVVLRTWLRGELVYDDGMFFPPPRGRETRPR